MKVLLPINETHTITLIPRFEPLGALSLEITKEGINTTVTQVPTYTVQYGIMSLTFDLIGVEQDRYIIVLKEGDNVVYRCRLFFTAQEIEDFKLTKDIYIYA